MKSQPTRQETNEDQQGPETLQIVRRRQFLLNATAAAAVLSWLGVSSDPSIAANRPATFKDALDQPLGGSAEEIDDRITLKLPEIAENGFSVPFSVSVNHPMTPDNYVKTVHVLASDNPWPRVATFRFTPISGIAKTSSRMRLARTQDVVAVAELSNGKTLLARHTVKVTRGGCGG